MVEAEAQALLGRRPGGGPAGGSRVIGDRAQPPSPYTWPAAGRHGVC
jgi:hypothetical protein